MVPLWRDSEPQLSYDEALLLARVGDTRMAREQQAKRRCSRVRSNAMSNVNPSEHTISYDSPHDLIGPVGRRTTEDLRCYHCAMGNCDPC
jgi:hypothetical protein